jgi:hypothetical protein
MPDEKIPAGSCQCGCGQATSIAGWTEAARGYVKGRPKRFVKGHGTRAVGVPLCGYVVQDCGYLTPCWIWKLTKSRGYGRKRWNGRVQGAHVMMWTQLHGPVPDGLELDHLCHVRACVNPDHLEPVTRSENQRRGLNGALRGSRPIT